MLRTFAFTLIILALIGVIMGYIFAIAQIKVIAEPGGYVDAAVALLLLAIATMLYDYFYFKLGSEI